MTGRITVAASGAGLSITTVKTVDVASIVPATKSLAAAKSGTLTVRTDVNTGTLTMAADHGISAGQRLDIFWTDPTTGIVLCQHKATVGTVVGNSVPIDLGVGSDLPAAASAVTVQVPTQVGMAFSHLLLSMLAVGATRKGKLVFEKADGTVVYHRTIAAALDSYTWARTNGDAVPLSDLCASVWMSNGDTAGTNVVTSFAAVTG